MTDRENALNGIGKLWGLGIRAVRDDLAIPGSPERCIERTVLEGPEGALYLLERLAEGDGARWEMMARTVDGLRRKGLPEALRYLESEEGAYVARAQGWCWRLSAFVRGTDLPRPEYIDDGVRGAHLADVLLKLSAASREIAACPWEQGFSLPSYVRELCAAIAQRQAGVMRALRPALDWLEPFFDAYAGLETAFCHGDYHPLNVIWDGREIAAVIDWEFMGMRPALYDAANLVGCVGSEDPQALVDGLVPAFMGRLREEGFVFGENRRWFAHLLLALRFAWLSEWLRRGDTEMIGMELEYMRIIRDNADVLRKRWEL